MTDLLVELGRRWVLQQRDQRALELAPDVLDVVLAELAGRRLDELDHCHDHSLHKSGPLYTSHESADQI